MRVCVLAVLAMILPAGVFAQSEKGMDGMKMDHGSMSNADKAQTRHKATGVVKSVDRKKGTATLAHDPVASLKWPAMTMAFGVKDKAMLDKLSANQKVQIEFMQQGKDYVITDVK